MKKIKSSLIVMSLICVFMATTLTAQDTKKEGDKEVTKTSQTSNDKLRNQADFPKFLKYFLEQTYYQNNFNKLLFEGDKAVTNFFHPVVGFARATNPGAFCVLEKDNNYGVMVPQEVGWEMNDITGLKFYNKMPKKGSCEESKDKNGVYYEKLKKFPQYWNHEKEKAVAFSLPAKYKSAQVMKVVILVDKWIVKQFYFAKIDKKWYLILSDDCDCSA
ncbi:MAG: hypothetical protein IPI12_03670 [Ignavibacteriales bacterium]|jgi:hypothetical protein|nr:hypothetical protein [Ignavibacteriales bacterium]MBK8661336.1 hypothetical protein [Ignavibacteriales bacterium]MBP9123491.1 hypothetical protein [Ignavibacteriaceae bacterium]